MTISRTGRTARILSHLPIWLCAVLPARVGNDCKSTSVVVWFPYLTI